MSGPREGTADGPTSGVSGGGDIVILTLGGVVVGGVVPLVMLGGPSSGSSIGCSSSAELGLIKLEEVEFLEPFRNFLSRNSRKLLELEAVATEAGAPVVSDDKGVFSSFLLLGDS